MILEVSPEDIRDVAAAVHSARKKQPEAEVISGLERKVLGAIQRRENMLEVDDTEAQALRNSLLQRAYDQRNTPEGHDYADLADRIERALDLPPLVEAPEPGSQ
jgi:hypothetical protein